MCFWFDSIFLLTFFKNSANINIEQNASSHAGLMTNLSIHSIPQVKAPLGRHHPNSLNMENLLMSTEGPFIIQLNLGCVMIMRAFLLLCLFFYNPTIFSAIILFYLLIYLFIYLSICLLIYLFIHLFIHNLINTKLRLLSCQFIVSCSNYIAPSGYFGRLVPNSLVLTRWQFSFYLYF